MLEKNDIKHPSALPYSYHTFMLAFSFDYDISDTEENRGNWVDDSLRNGSDETESRLNYQMYQYFTPEARNLMFNKDTIKCDEDPAERNKNRIKRWRYNIPENSDREYIIKKAQKDDNKNKTEIIDVYRLTIDSIRATVFSNNIAILQFELENHDENHRDLDSVKQINEYGRRINMPFLVDDEKSHPLVADSISIMGNEVEMSSFGKRSLENFKKNDSSSLNTDIIPPIMDLIRELLPGKKEKPEISPVIDDRMFVCCLVRDEKFSNEVKSLQLVGDDPIPTVGKDIYSDTELANKIYSFAYIDADDSSCQSPEMREALLKRCVYSRWRDWGTIDVITHHSLVRVTGEYEGLTVGVINPFLTQYVTMAAGVLLQRATLMKLSKECAYISSDYFDGEKTKGENKELNERIKKLKRDYVYAQNNIFLTQFTVQEQGIDEFDMMRNETYITDLLKNLSHKVNGIYDYTTEYAEEKENEILNWITRIGLPLAAINLVVDIVGLVLTDSLDLKPFHLLISICLVGVCAVFAVIFPKSKNKKNKRKK